MSKAKRLKVVNVGLSPSIVRKVRLKGIPLAPLTLKSYVENRLKKESLNLCDIEVKTFFISETIPEEMAKQILEANPDVVAFSVYIWSYFYIMRCAQIIKEKDERVIIVCGGPHVSPVATDIIKEHPYIDAIPYITTPGELIFYQFIKAIIKGNDFSTVEGIVFRKKQGKLIKTNPLSEKLDYSNAPSPYLDAEFSLPSGDNYVVSLEGSRGCPYDCGYCFNGRGMKKINFFSLERMLKEIEVVYNNPDVKYVFYADSDILLDYKRAKAIINHILKQKSSVITEFTINILRLDEDIARLLAKLPHYRFCFALQTANPKALQTIGSLRPGVDDFVKKIEEFRKWLPNYEYSIDVMLGLPSDDFEGFKKTLDLCLALTPTRIALNYPVYLLPGTRFLQQREEYKISHNKKQPFYVVETSTFPKSEIEHALRLILWVDILTYFYPAIGQFLYKLCANDSDGMRIQKVESWIGAISEKIDLFDSHKDIVNKIEEGLVDEWNKVKGHLLHKASIAENAYHIYSTIKKQEENGSVIAEGKMIDLGSRIFDYMKSNNISSVEFSEFDQLPADIVKDYRPEEVRNVFSIYRK